MRILDHFLCNQSAELLDDGRHFWPHATGRKHDHRSEITIIVYLYISIHIYNHTIIFCAIFGRAIIDSLAIVSAKKAYKLFNHALWSEELEWKWSEVQRERKVIRAPRKNFGLLSKLCSEKRNVRKQRPQ